MKRVQIILILLLSYSSVSSQFSTLKDNSWPGIKKFVVQFSKGYKEINLVDNQGRIYNAKLYRKSKLIREHDLKYNEHGDKIFSQIKYSESGENRKNGYSTWEYKYDKNGIITFQKHTYNDGDPTEWRLKEPIEDSLFTYTKNTTEGEREYIIKYNKAGNIVLKKYYSESEEHYITETIDYDSFGNFIRIKKNDEENELIYDCRYTLEYDKKGRIKKSYIQNLGNEKILFEKIKYFERK